MACNCGSGNRLAKAGVGAQAGTYRVMVTDGNTTRKVYESVSEAAAKTVAANFANAEILVPGQ